LAHYYACKFDGNRLRIDGSTKTARMGKLVIAMYRLRPTQLRKVQFIQNCEVSTGPDHESLYACRVDSIMLLEEGFKVTSTDASDKMLKYAMKERWNRRKQPAFDKWGMYL